MLLKKMNKGLLFLMIVSAGINAIEITNPIEVIDGIRKTMREFSAEVQKLAGDEKTFLKSLALLMQKYEQQCPFFLLNECRAEMCWASRKFNPHYRDSFEEQISNYLVAKTHSNNNVVMYTSFASGDAFPEMVILAKTLAKKPDAHITIHLIDSNYKEYVALKNYFGLSREIIVDQGVTDCIDTLDRNTLDEYIKQRREKENNIRLTDEQFRVAILNNYCITQKRFQQLKGWLAQTFPKARLSLFLHDSVEHYFEYMDKHNLPYADVIAAADIQIDKGMMPVSQRLEDYLGMGIIEDYATLCTKTLEKKPDCYNAWLAIDAGNAEIFSFSPKEVKNAKKIDLGNGTFGYLVTVKKL
jgi:hypothetical protein